MTTDVQIKKQNDLLVITRLAALEKMDLSDLKKEWELYHNGEKAPAYGKQFLIRKLAWRIQETYYGGLSTLLSAQLRNIAIADPKYKLKAQNSKHKNSKKKEVLPGTRFIRVWKDQRIEVIALEGKRFQYNDQVFRSLSAIAREITGTNWNGNVFFGLTS